MENLYQAVKDYIEDHRSEMLAMWKDFAETPSQARDREAATKMADKLVELLKGMDMQVNEYDVGPVNSRLIEAVWGADRPGQPILFGGHYDTVNSSPVENPVPGSDNEFDGTPHFRMDDQGRAFGLGVLDMKGGIVISIYVVKALAAIGYEDRPIKLIFCGDEEIGHPKSTAGQIFMDESKGAACAFNMETGLIDNSLCVGRKTANNYTVEVTGVESHAGNDFESGRSAIAEACRKVTDIQALTDLSKGTTVNTGTIQGGTVPNAVPGYCKFVVNARFESYEELDRVNKAVVEICERTYIDGTHTTVDYHKKAFPIFECTEGVMDFWNFSAKIAERYGFEKLGHKKLGGGSDASGICAVGTPVICSYGVRGEHNHTDREYALVETLFERTKLIAAVIKDLAEYKNA